MKRSIWFIENENIAELLMAFAAYTLHGLLEILGSEIVDNIWPFIMQ